MSSSVAVNNTTIFVQTINNQAASVGMQPLPPGTSADAATKAVEASLLKYLGTDWTTVYPTNPLGTNTDQGMMGPWSDNVPGTAPQCVLDQVNQDFSNWGLPINSQAATQIGKAITTGIGSNGGLPGYAHGLYTVTPSESILWLVEFLTADISISETGVIFVWGAGLAVNLASDSPLRRTPFGVHRHHTP